MSVIETVMDHLACLKAGEYVQKPDGSLRPEDIERDDNCRLGKWVNAEVAKPGAPESLSALKKEHTRLHRATAEIVRQANAGVLTEGGMANNGEYKRSLGKFFSLVMELEKELP